MVVKGLVVGVNASEGVRERGEKESIVGVETREREGMMSERRYV